MELYGTLEKRNNKPVFILREPIQFPEDGIKDTLTEKDFDGKLPKYPVSYVLSVCFLKNGKLHMYDYKEIAPVPSEYVSYLATFSGVGSGAAKRINYRYGFRSLSVMAYNPESLLKIKGFTKERADKTQLSVLERIYAKDYFAYMRLLGIRAESIKKAYIKSKEEGKKLSDIKRNPYPFLDFYDAEKISEFQNLSETNPERIKAGIVECLIEVERGGEMISGNTGYSLEGYNSLTYQEMEFIGTGYLHKIAGSTCISPSNLRLLAIKLLGINITKEEYERFLDELSDDNAIYIDRAHERISRIEMHEMESGSDRLVRKLCENKYPHDKLIYRKINNAEAEIGIKLSNQQTDAVKMAIENSLSVLTGGPGTGKTSVQRCLIAVFKKMYPEKSLIMCAPTGKAAKRMGEATGEKATTIHKLLNLKGGSDEKEIMAPRTYKINNALIILDEVSMIDTSLFNCFVRSIGNGVHILMVGDIEQLPSIGAGAVLKDMINSDVVPVTKLTKTFRQADESLIPINAARIKDGNTTLEFGNDFSFIECDTSEQISEKAAELTIETIKKEGLENVICLTGYRTSTITGSNSMNEIIRERLRGDEIQGIESFEANGVPIYEGDLVMYTKNNNGITNGDVGKVLKITHVYGHTNCVCDFDGEEITLSDESLQSLVLAYCLTIHKSQGSEYKTVIMIIDKAHSNLLYRNLVYTGLTRAKVKCICIGQKEALENAIKNASSASRVTSFLK